MLSQSSERSETFLALGWVFFRVTLVARPGFMFDLAGSCQPIEA
jgi:hypothetical protein